MHARDAAGNDGPVDSHTYTLNTALPATPTIDSSQASPGSDRSPTWTYSSSQGGVTLDCQLDDVNGNVYPWEDCDSGTHSFDLTARPDGVYTFSVRADNGLTQGAPATTNYTLDTTAPGVPTFPLAPATPGNDQTPEWTLAATGAAVKFECRLMDGATQIESRDPCTSPANFDLSSESDGTYTLESRAFDAAGNGSGWSTSAYALDTTAPPAPTVGAPTTPSSDATPTFTFSAAGASGFECRVERGALVVDDWAVCASPWTYDLGGETDGTYTVLVRARDAVGNRSASDSSTYRVDRSVPAAPDDRHHAGPARQGPLAAVVVPRRGGGDVRVPPGARRDRDQRVGIVRESEDVLAGQRGRRRLHVLRPREERSRHGRSRRPPATTSSTPPPRRRRRSASEPPAVASSRAPTVELRCRERGSRRLPRRPRRDGDQRLGRTARARTSST